MSFKVKGRTTPKKYTVIREYSVATAEEALAAARADGLEPIEVLGHPGAGGLHVPWGKGYAKLALALNCIGGVLRLYATHAVYKGPKLEIMVEFSFKFVILAGLIASVVVVIGSRGRNGKLAFGVGVFFFLASVAFAAMLNDMRSKGFY